MWRAICAALKYEFLMQIRRPFLWSLLPAMASVSGWGMLKNLLARGAPVEEIVPVWTLMLNVFAPIGFGLLLADRWARDMKLGVAELLETAPASPVARLLGKYFGTVLASMLPLWLVYVAGIAYTALRTEYPTGQLILLALYAYAAITVPGLLFVAAFALTCPLWMPVPLYQVLYTGYWFWGNLLDPRAGIPTISRTILTPWGAYAAGGLFNRSNLGAPGASPWLACLSIASLLTTAAAALVVGYLFHRRQLRGA